MDPYLDRLDERQRLEEEIGRVTEEFRDELYELLCEFEKKVNDLEACSPYCGLYLHDIAKEDIAEYFGV